MLDINLIRERPDFVKDGMRKVGEDPAVIDRVLDLDRRWRGAVTESEELKAERKRVSKAIGRMPTDKREAVVSTMRMFEQSSEKLGTAIEELREQFSDLISGLPKAKSYLNLHSRLSALEETEPRLAGGELEEVSALRTLLDLVREEGLGGTPEQSAKFRELTERLSASESEVAALRGQLDHLHSLHPEMGYMRTLGNRVKALDAESAAARQQLDDLMLRIPNVPHEDAPVGKDESENVVVRTVGERPQFDFEPKPHWDLGPALGILDFERGVKLTGSRFYVLLREGARLQRALISFMLDVHTREHGYTEAYPPYLVNGKCLVGTGNLPKFADNLYHDAEEDLWLIPTAEVPLTNMHREEILDEAALPKRYVGYTACFRREKMSAGKDVRGIKRGHQFDKVELVKLTRPEDSDAELARLLGDAEDVCRRLELPYRVVEMCTGDLSFVACRKFDIEVWAAGCGEWLEVSSCSTFRDFQARRADIRYRGEAGGGTAFVHTLNGSGLALPRTLIAVIENNQQADGSVLIPEALRPYMGGAERIERG